MGHAPNQLYVITVKSGASQPLQAPVRSITLNYMQQVNLVSLRVWLSETSINGGDDHRQRSVAYGETRVFTCIEPGAFGLTKLFRF